MNFEIQAKCIGNKIKDGNGKYQDNQCTFSGNYDEVFEHCKKTGHGDYGSHLWGGNTNRCNMELEPSHVIRAILQASMNDIVEGIFTYDKTTYKNVLYYLFDTRAVDRLPTKIEGDDIVDVIEKLSDTSIKKAIRNHLLDTSWVNTIPMIQNRQNVKRMPEK